ncbi:MAG: copper resistance protein CopC [Dermatophilaceae bacterium]
MTVSPGGRRPWVAARRGRLIQRLVLVLLAAAAVALTGPAPAAQAHAFLASSNPADGSVVVDAPTTLELGFSESVVLAAMRIDVVDGQGHHVAPTHVRLKSEGEPRDIEDPVAVLADLPALARGIYRVSWETLSADDLHRTAGVLVFGVGAGQSVQAAGVDEPQPRIDEASLRWLVLMSLALCLGGALASRLLSRDRLSAAGSAASAARAAAAARAAYRWALAGATVGAVVTVLLLVDQLAPGTANARQLLFGWYGERWLLRELGLVLLLVSTVLALKGRRPRLRAGLLVTGATMAAVGAALLGHAGADTGLGSTRVVADAAHLVAATTWAGTLVVLVLVVGPRLVTGALGFDAVRGALRGFGVPAAACVSMMVVTGVYLTSEVVGSVDAALLTTYGRILLVKIAVAALAGALALVTHLRLRRGRRGALPRRAVAIEASAAVVALALAALLTSGQPAREPQFVNSASSVASQVVDGPVGDLQESVSISPNRPGASVVLVDVFETRRPSPGPVREVLISLDGASGPQGEPQPAERLSDGRWSLATQLVSSGLVQVHVLVRRSGLPDAAHSFPWTVGNTRVLTRPAVVSTAPVGGVLRLAAAVLLFLVLALWVLVPLRRLRRRRREVAIDRHSLVSQMGSELSTAATAAEEARQGVGISPGGGA